MSGGGGGGTNTVQTQKADPWWGAESHLIKGYEMADKAADTTPTTPYTGQFYASPNQYQTMLPQQLAAAAQRMQGAGDSSVQLGQDMASGKYLDANTYLKPAIEATVNPVIRNVRESVLPGIGSAAQTSGAYGGSRQAVLEAQTLRDTQQTVADTAAKMFNDNYGRERQLQMMAPSLISAGSQLNTVPLTLLEQAGTQQYNLDSMPLREQQAKWQEELNAPWRAVNPFTAVMSGIGSPGGSTQSTTQLPETSKAAAGISGATAGAAVGLALASAFPALGIPLWAAALGGGALGGGAGLLA